MNYRKPVSFQMYHFILVRTHGIWCFDSGTWNDIEGYKLNHDALHEYGRNNVKACTSPSDDETVLNRIVKAMNRN